MSSATEKIREEIRHLPYGARMQLVRELEHDLDTDEAAAGPEIEAAWEAEEANRANEIMNGSVQLLTEDDLTRRLDAIRAKHMA
jgi:hypothetical protein